ncbi:exodeoxyribonuclease VII small subunit [Slackia equolifaciens]|uniref:Exodeoxyribonuclease 7 small subunit n=1 Tax=Slackia equolifaciens TaxID=498718 RepID=A0A3N0B1R5_9ACTN|nr:exodeoxyribonuclease VII small subunit [Slackia equolifaciens]RNL41071.1 exodeoxyribonuclease VII small subunit [Slackia equolifaciens]
MEQNQAASLDQMTFRQEMAELDRIVSVLESNTLELEDSLASYERGVTLLADLKSRLSDAQQKVDVLMGQLDAPADDATTDTTLS